MGLFYKQMEGLVRGYQARAQLRAASDPGVVDLTAELMERGILMINFLPDFWDMIEAYHLFAPKGPSVNDVRRI